MQRKKQPGKTTWGKLLLGGFCLPRAYTCLLFLWPLKLQFLDKDLRMTTTAKSQSSRIGKLIIVNKLRCVLDPGESGGHFQGQQMFYAGGKSTLFSMGAYFASQNRMTSWKLIRIVGRIVKCGHFSIQYRFTWKNIRNF